MCAGRIRGYRDVYQRECLEGFEGTLARIRHAQVLKSLQGRLHQHVLEIGCGLYPFCCHWHDYQTYAVVEPIGEFAKVARVCGVKVLQNTLENAMTDLVGRPFDFVILSSVLHEIAHPKELLQSIHRLCGPETVVHINVPNSRSFHRLLGVEMGILQQPQDKSDADLSFGRHLGSLDIASFVEMLSSQFIILDCGTYFVKPFSNSQMVAMATDDMIKGLSGMIKYLPDMGCEIYANIRKKL